MVVVEAVETQTTQTAMAAAEVTAKIQTVEEMTMSNKTHGQDVHDDLTTMATNTEQLVPTMSTEV